MFAFLRSYPKKNVSKKAPKTLKINKWALRRIQIPEYQSQGESRRGGPNATLVLQKAKDHGFRGIAGPMQGGFCSPF